MATFASAELLTPVWVQLGEHGQAIVRVVVDSPQACPEIRLDRTTRKMEPRLPVPEGFRPACETVIPVGAKKAQVRRQKLHLPPSNPSRMIAFGDTGCRVLGDTVQNCNDLQDWPFESVALAGAASHPQLMLHVGDYLYRESACPSGKEAFCGGSPHGDNWETWNADFFKPAAPLLAEAPWIFARGNHESCARQWRGWSYYLDTHPWTGVCQNTPPPVTVELGQFRVVLLDTSALVDLNLPPELVDTYAALLSTVKTKHAWLLDHHPPWALRQVTADGPPVPLNPALAQAWEKGKPQGIDMVVSGHTHVFELLSFRGQRPVQLVAGNGGTALDFKLPSHVEGIPLQGFMIAEGETERVFGYTVLRKKGAGWRISLRTPDGQTIVNCSLKGQDIACALR